MAAMQAWKTWELEPTAYWNRSLAYRLNGNGEEADADKSRIADKFSSQVLQVYMSSPDAHRSFLAWNALETDRDIGE